MWEKINDLSSPSKLQNSVVYLNKTPNTEISQLLLTYDPTLKKYHIVIITHTPDDTYPLIYNLHQAGFSGEGTLMHDKQSLRFFNESSKELRFTHPDPTMMTRFMDAIKSVDSSVLEIEADLQRTFNPVLHEPAKSFLIKHLRIPKEAPNGNTLKQMKPNPTQDFQSLSDTLLGNRKCRGYTF